MLGLPQELIDHVVDSIDSIHDRKTLEACSLLSSQWVARCQKHLFAQVEFASEKDLLRWCTRIRPGPLGTSSLVEDLTLSEDQEMPWPPLSSLPDPISHLQSFSGLRRLTIRSWDMPTYQAPLMLRYFGPSLGNVTRLTLEDVSIRPQSLAMFVTQFPRLTNISICGISPPTAFNSPNDLHDDFDVVPTRPCGGFIVSNTLNFPFACVFKVITLLEPRFRQVGFAFVAYPAWRDYWPIVEACAGSLEELCIIASEAGGNCEGLSLSGCPNLRKIKLSLGDGHPAQPCEFIEKCLSTITSTQLSKVVFALRGDVPEFLPPGVGLQRWDSLDVVLHKLARQYRPRCEGDKMVVELWHPHRPPEQARNLLWRYGERGTLRVIRGF